MKRTLLVISAYFLPVLAFAQTNIGNFEDVKNTLLYLINSIFVPVIFALAFVVFIWGVFKYFILGASGDDKKEALNLILYGLVGFFLMLSVWGLVNVLTGTFRFGENNPPVDLPGVSENSVGTGS